MSENDLQFYLSVLKSNECQCGEFKKVGYALCHRCYFSLPNQHRIDLYQQLCNGFEEAYDQAVEFLND